MNRLCLSTSCLLYLLENNQEQAIDTHRVLINSRGAMPSASNTGIGTQKRRYSDWVPAIYEQRCRSAHNTYRASKRAHSMRSGNVAALCRLARPAGGLREQSKQTQNIVFFDCDWPRITFVVIYFDIAITK
ncbi:hypothetical protein ACJJTC_012737 [Scirpophaga incertulas]